MGRYHGMLGEGESGTVFDNGNECESIAMKWGKIFA
jgi:hypothetical protein